MDVEHEIRSCLDALPQVSKISLVGSRATRRAVPLSDWDFAIETSDFDAVGTALPVAVAPLEPLSAMWDPLSRRANFMLILDGPHKVDLLFDHAQEQALPWTPTRATMSEIDSHFWDWIYWLAAKRQQGKDDVVGTELATMMTYLLSPLGVHQQPVDLAEAIHLYVIARHRLERKLGVTVQDRLGATIQASLRRHGIID